MAFTILVVDDDPDDMEITSHVLQKSGYPVHCVGSTSGEAALRMLRSSSELPSLMFLDLKMPGMDGLATLRRIRADERTREIPVVILTNSNLESDRRAATAAGADSFIHKAFDMGQYATDIGDQLDYWLQPQPAIASA